MGLKTKTFPSLILKLIPSLININPGDAKQETGWSMIGGGIQFQQYLSIFSGHDTKWEWWWCLKKDTSLVFFFHYPYFTLCQTQNKALLGASNYWKPAGCCYATIKYVWGVLLLSFLLPFSNLCTEFWKNKNGTFLVLSALPPSLSVNRGLWWICSLL